MNEVTYIDWHVTPFRADRFIETWRPAAARALAFGASNWSLTRSTDDPLHIRQTATWENREDFERYWYSDEITSARQQVVDYYGKPVLPVWHSLVGAE
jgi:quinol monooxygenase YgiN